LRNWISTPSRIIRRSFFSTTIIQLYKEDIQDGVLTKEDARNAILQSGLIIFRPKVKNCLGKPSKLYEKGHIAILDIAAVKLQKDRPLLSRRMLATGKSLSSQSR
jgi:hypothetical protein